MLARQQTHPSLRKACLHSGQAAFRRRSLKPVSSKPEKPKFPSSQQNIVRVVSVLSASSPRGHCTGTAADAPPCAGITVEQGRKATELTEACAAEQQDAPKRHGKSTIDLPRDESERLVFVQRVTELLFTIEFVVLIECVGLIVPIIYSIYVVRVYHLENRAYYAQIAAVDDDGLKRTILNVMIYASLEFVSFVIISIAIYRRMGIATLKQLSFVLERQWSMVHTKLLTWFFFVVQNSLDHFGTGMISASGSHESRRSCNAYYVGTFHAQILALTGVVADAVSLFTRRDCSRAARSLIELSYPIRPTKLSLGLKPQDVYSRSTSTSKRSLSISA